MIIVTGGAGFIGSALIRGLNERGQGDILVVDRLGTGPKWKNLVGKRYLDYLHKDQFLQQLLGEGLGDGEGIEAVVHLGACSATTEPDADYLWNNNFKYSQILASWCLEKGIRFLYASSAATYGDGAQGFLDDDAAVPGLRPLNMYGYSKQRFDEWALESGALQRIAGFKFFNVFGPNEAHKGEMRSLVDKAVEQIQRTGRLQLFKSADPAYKDGEFTRDFIYVKDVVAVLLKALDDPKVAGLYNLGSGTERSWNDLGAAIFKALGKPVAIDYIDMPEALRGKYQYRTRAEMGKLRQALGLLPIRSLEDAVDDYVKQHLLPDTRW